MFTVLHSRLFSPAAICFFFQICLREHEQPEEVVYKNYCTVGQGYRSRFLFLGSHFQSSLAPGLGGRCGALGTPHQVIEMPAAGYSLAELVGKYVRRLQLTMRKHHLAQAAQSRGIHVAELAFCLNGAWSAKQLPFRFETNRSLAIFLQKERPPLGGLLELQKGDCSMRTATNVRSSGSATYLAGTVAV